MDNIHITEGEFYALSDVIDAVQKVLDRVNEQSVQSKLRYSSTDLYWLLCDMLRYVNQNVPGEFLLRPTQKGIYRVIYTAETRAKQRSNRKLKTEVNRTADYLEELTGKRPSWGEEKKEP